MPSFFQKRLLKYVLSRVGLVETDALDLDNLGISWGQRSVVELKDIGLKLDVSCDRPTAGCFETINNERDRSRLTDSHREIETINPFEPTGFMRTA